MKPHESDGGEALVAARAIRAMMDAEWEASDILARKSPDAARDLLQGRAAELATSWLGDDQIMSVALDAAANDIGHGRPPLASGSLFFFEQRLPATTRVDVQRAVFSAFGLCDFEADEVVAQREATHRSELGRTSAFAELSRRLIDEARLHKHLWDDPRIPAGPNVRLVMLCSVPRLIDRARAIDPMRVRAIHSLLKWPRGRAVQRT